MRLPATFVLALGAFASLPLGAAVSSGCSSGSGSAGTDAGGSTFPDADGAACGCATPDCLPNCSDLPACKLECVSAVAADGAAFGGGDGGIAGGPSLVWVDLCGEIQYAEACPSGCETDAAAASCH